MRKVGIITLVLVLLLGLGAMSAYAKAQKLTLSKFSGIPAEYPFDRGKVIVNNPAGAVNLVVQFTVKGLKPNCDYWAWMSLDGAFPATNCGNFTTNAQGNANVHYNTYVAPGGYTIQFGVNDLSAFPPKGFTVLITAVTPISTK